MKVRILLFPPSKDFVVLNGSTPDVEVRFESGFILTSIRLIFFYGLDQSLKSVLVIRLQTLTWADG